MSDETVPHPLDEQELLEDTLREARAVSVQVYYGDEKPSWQESIGCNSSQCAAAGDCYCP